MLIYRILTSFIDVSVSKEEKNYRNTLAMCSFVRCYTVELLLISLMQTFSYLYSAIWRYYICIHTVFVYSMSGHTFFVGNRQERRNQSERPSGSSNLYPLRQQSGVLPMSHVLNFFAKILSDIKTTKTQGTIQKILTFIEDLDYVN